MRIGTLQFIILRAMQDSTFTRRPDAPPAEEVPDLASLIDGGLIYQRGARWILTEDGCAAIEAYQQDRKRS